MRASGGPIPPGNRIRHKAVEDTGSPSSGQPDRGSATRTGRSYYMYMACGAFGAPGSDAKGVTTVGGPVPAGSSTWEWIKANYR